MRLSSAIRQATRGQHWPRLRLVHRCVFSNLHGLYQVTTEGLGLLTVQVFGQRLARFRHRLSDEGRAQASDLSSRLACAAAYAAAATAWQMLAMARQVSTARRLLGTDPVHLCPALLICLVPVLPHVRNRPIAGHTYVLTRWLFLRLLGVTYLCAFASLWPQLPALIGRNGILPAADFLQALQDPLGVQRYWRVPTLAWLSASDDFLRGICGAGILLSLLLIVGIWPAPVLLSLWVCYLSLVSICQDFLAFQWDALLLETGFLAIFFAPLQLRPGLSRESEPSRTVLWLLRWLLFRLIFFSGVVKLRSGDPTWRNLTALSFHYETQPLPTPAAWYMHQLPSWFHRLSTAFALATELGAPFLIFAPRRARFVGASLLTGLLLLIALTGNYGFFNLLSMVLCTILLDDTYLRRYLPPQLRSIVDSTPRRATPIYQRALAVPLTVMILLLSGVQFANLFAVKKRVPRHARSVAEKLMPWYMVNPYGLFAVMTTSRPEIVIEGSRDGHTWVEYTFRYKPSDVNRPPPWVAPHQPRLDWQMWFAALSHPWNNRWFGNFLLGLLQGSPEVLDLLETNPFPEAPPHYVRALLYDYRLTKAQSSDGAWWQRELLGLYFPPVSLMQL